VQPVKLRTIALQKLKGAGTVEEGGEKLPHLPPASPNPNPNRNITTLCYFILDFSTFLLIFVHISI